MNILIDYDNVRRQHTSRGLVYVADRLLQVAFSTPQVSPRQVRMRLYGGWYEGNALSRRAQDLAAEVMAEFPRVMHHGSVSVQVHMELAYSLEIEPARHILHTYRRSGHVDHVACRPPIAAGCAEPACVLEPMYRFLTTGSCPLPSCPLEPSDLLFRQQQKLVDSMLTADIIFLAQHPPPLCVVSSDDDLWPGVRTALLQGKPILHVHTVAGHSTVPYYSQGLRSLYTEAHL